MATPTPSALTTGFKQLDSIGAIGTGPGNVRKLFGYNTNDTKAQVETAGYFNPIIEAYSGLLSIGDIVMVSGDSDGTPFGAIYVFNAVTADVGITEFTNGGTATAAEVSRVADVSARMVTLSGSTSITEATHESKTCLLTGTGSAFTQTLPAATGSGAKYRFVVGAVNTSNHVITTTGGDVFKGVIIANSTGDTPDLAQPWTSSANTIITLNGTTTGGQAIGDFIEVQDIAADTWAVRGVVSASGTEATPFSGP